MDKQLRVFIIIVIIFIGIAGILTINEIVEPMSVEVGESNANVDSVINEDGSVYVIGKHLFTSDISYLSTTNILTAAKTIEGFESMTDDEILENVTVYARDEENNWINAMTGEMITFPDDFEFDIKYIDLKEIPTKVETEEELRLAIADSNITAIDITKDIELNSNIIIDNRNIEINLNGHSIKVLNEKADSISGNALIDITNGSSIIFNGHGSVIAGEFEGGAILSSNSYVEINDVDVSGKYGIVVASGVNDDTEDERNYNVRANDSTIVGEDAGIYFTGASIVQLYNCTLRGNNGNAISIFEGDVISNDDINGNEILEVTENEGKLSLNIDEK